MPIKDPIAQYIERETAFKKASLPTFAGLFIGGATGAAIGTSVGFLVGGVGCIPGCVFGAIVGVAATAILIPVCTYIGYLIGWRLEDGENDKRNEMEKVASKVDEFVDNVLKTYSVAKALQMGIKKENQDEISFKPRHNLQALAEIKEEKALINAAIKLQRIRGISTADRESAKENKKNSNNSKERLKNSAEREAQKAYNQAKLNYFKKLYNDKHPSTITKIYRAFFPKTPQIKLKNKVDNMTATKNSENTAENENPSIYDRIIQLICDSKLKKEKDRKEKAEESDTEEKENIARKFNTDVIGKEVSNNEEQRKTRWNSFYATFWSLTSKQRKDLQDTVSQDENIVKISYDRAEIEDYSKSI